MPRFLRVIAGLLIVTVMAAGAVIWRASPVGADAKLAAAFPIAPALQGRFDTLARFNDPAGVQNVQQQLHVRLQYRLLKCAGTYVPSWYERLESVKTNVSDPDCFARQERELAQWFGLVEVGLILRQPPLRPTPREPFQAITVEDTVHFVRYAREAGVAALHEVDQAQIIDLNTGEALLRLNKPDPRSTWVLTLSPNGRLYEESGPNGETYLKSVEDGRTVMQMPVMQGCNFTWLDARTSTCLNDHNVNFIDYGRGTQIRTDLFTAPFMLGAAVPGKPDHYVLLHTKKTIEVQLVQRDGTPKVQVVREPATESLGYYQDSEALNRAELSADGSSYLMPINDQHLLVLSLQDLQSRLFDVSPFRIDNALPTPDPNQVLLYGGVKAFGDIAPNGVVLDIAQQRMAPVTLVRRYDHYMNFSPATQTMAVLRKNTVTLLKTLPVGESRALADWRVFVGAEAERLDADKQQMLKELREANEARAQTRKNTL